MRNRQLNFREERVDAKRRIEFIKNNPHPISLVLDGLSNPRNIASIFRIAEAARVKCIYGYQMPGLEKEKKFTRISRNTIDLVPFKVLENVEQLKLCLTEMKIVALEITDTSIPYMEYHPEKECCLIIGNEKNGVRPELLQLAETCIHIPMYGLNTSMNVAVATGIATFSILEKILK